MVSKNMVVAGLFVATLLGAACGGDDGGSDASGGGSDAGGAATSVEVAAADFTFEPADVSVAAGGSIELTNEDDAKHSFTADEAGIDEDVDAGASTTIDVGDAEPGSYDYICKYHPEMKGTLEITE